MVRGVLQRLWRLEAVKAIENRSRELRPVASMPVLMEAALHPACIRKTASDRRIRTQTQTVILGPSTFMARCSKPNSEAAFCPG
jgi:hypothetical protein